MTTEELLKEILDQLKYQTKLLEGAFGDVDEKRHTLAESKKQMDSMVAGFMNNPFIQMNPEAKALFQNLMSPMMDNGEEES